MLFLGCALHFPGSDSRLERVSCMLRWYLGIYRMCVKYSGGGGVVPGTQILGKLEGGSGLLALKYVTKHFCMAKITCLMAAERMYMTL